MLINTIEGFKKKTWRKFPNKNILYFDIHIWSGYIRVRTYTMEIVEEKEMGEVMKKNFYYCDGTTGWWCTREIQSSPPYNAACLIWLSLSSKGSTRLRSPSLPQLSSSSASSYVYIYVCIRWPIEKSLQRMLINMWAPLLGLWGIPPSSSLHLSLVIHVPLPHHYPLLSSIDWRL